jgi:hypothetical protein
VPSRRLLVAFDAWVKLGQAFRLVAQLNDEYERAGVGQVGEATARYYAEQSRTVREARHKLLAFMRSQGEVDTQLPAEVGEALPLPPIERGWWVETRAPAPAEAGAVFPTAPGYLRLEAC